MLLDFVFRQFNKESDPLTNLKDNSQVLAFFVFIIWATNELFFWLSLCMINLLNNLTTSRTFCLVHTKVRIPSGLQALATLKNQLGVLVEKLSTEKKGNTQARQCYSLDTNANASVLVFSVFVWSYEYRFQQIKF